METETDIDLDAIRKEVESESHEKLVAVLADSNHDKLSRDHAVSAIGDEIVEKLKEKCSPHRIRHFFTNTVKKMVRYVECESNHCSTNHIFCENDKVKGRGGHFRAFTRVCYLQKKKLDSE